MLSNPLQRKTVFEYFDAALGTIEPTVGIAE